MSDTLYHLCVTIKTAQAVAIKYLSSCLEYHVTEFSSNPSSMITDVLHVTGGSIRDVIGHDKWDTIPINVGRILCATKAPVASNVIIRSALMGWMHVLLNRNPIGVDILDSNESRFNNPSEYYPSLVTGDYRDTVEPFQIYLCLSIIEIYGWNALRMLPLRHTFDYGRDILEPRLGDHLFEIIRVYVHDKNDILKNATIDPVPLI